MIRNFQLLSLIVTALFSTSSNAAESFYFENQISPILSRFSCNAAGCHGKAEGQGGFKLSVFAFDPDADHTSITKEGRGRRIMIAAPDESLLLRKATGRMPHGGGSRIKFGSSDYQTLRDWIAMGAPVGNPDAPRIESLRVEPGEKVLGFRTSLQLKVIARFTDGREQDVTNHARFQTNNDSLASVSAEGSILTTEIPGEVAVMAAYLGQVGMCRVIIPRPGVAIATNLPRFNFIDELVDRKLAKLNISPSSVCNDAEFLRRVHIDLNGTLPIPSEVREFLADKSKDKRSRKIDELLNKPAYADLMALQWADLLRVDRLALGHQKAFAYYRWLQQSFAVNKPFDKFASEFLTAEGLISESPSANYFRVVSKPGEAASNISQVFLGVRIACAECHHHPFDRWSQTDYAGMVAFFSPLAIRGSKDAEVLSSVGNPTTSHPRSGLPVMAHALGVPQPKENRAGERRTVLAQWMTDRDNPFFARNVANRMWAHLLGRGLVEPVDDVRATNPPTNPELLDGLAKYTIEQKYDLKQLIRLICNSRVYQSSSTPNTTNEKDEQNYSRALFKRPSAEVLLDMIGTTTGIRDRFPGMPPETKAVQVWDSQIKHEFLKLFGRPERTTACDCERNREPSTGQVLSLLNSPELQRKLSHDGGLIAKLESRLSDHVKLVEELYLVFFARLPSDQERVKAVAYLQKKQDRRKATEDLAWAMLNSLEFQFNH